MMVIEEKDQIKEKLKDIFGYTTFRGNQEVVIKNILSGRNTFVIMPTGAGKSLCYQLQAMVRDGLAIVISPLIALMKNQVDQLNAYGINARFLNSTLSKGEITRLKKNFDDIGNVLVKTINRIDDLRNKQEDISGVPTGFPSLDRVTYGWQPTDLIILAARPSVGSGCSSGCNRCTDR